jgi:hypothetical protein
MSPRRGTTSLQSGLCTISNGIGFLFGLRGSQGCAHVLLPVTLAMRDVKANLTEDVMTIGT